VQSKAVEIWRGGVNKLMKINMMTKMLQKKEEEVVVEKEEEKEGMLIYLETNPET
jgi:hypothetical protein